MKSPHPAPARFPRWSFFFFAGILIAGCGLIRSSHDLATRAGEPLEVRLPANFSTGYRWILDPPMQTARLVSESYLPSPEARPGAPGTQILRVVFPREGRFNLKLASRRLWESSSVPAAQTTNFVVQVLSSGKTPSMMEQLFPPQSSGSQIPQPEEEAPIPFTNRIQLRRP
ncbi:MAG: hypothetical protein EBZ78_09505 [Verrucomicrobia bacterium]|nr:hypothetical protein [Verrucomicrobiota bacterium]